jgi:phosphoribosyl-AMP cyclohydrolase
MPAAMAADAGTPRASAGGAGRRPVDVAVGVLVAGDGRVLLASRPAGKPYAGYWEFPGGKLEPGETVEAALERELREELGIEIAAPERWRESVVDYPHARVRLHFCKVTQWRGEPERREGQQLAWQSLPVALRPVLPGTLPVLAWLAAERGHGGPTHYTCPMDPLDPAFDRIRWDRDGLVPVIAQEAGSNDVLMFAWMNRAALAATLERGEAVYWSRSRGRLWHKGEESGHVQRVQEVRLDCDDDVLLLKVVQQGHDPAIACHTGRHSCFYRRWEDGAWVDVEPVLKDPATIYR